MLLELCPTAAQRGPYNTGRKSRLLRDLIVGGGEAGEATLARGGRDLTEAAGPQDWPPRVWRGRSRVLPGLFRIRQVRRHEASLVRGSEKGTLINASTHTDQTCNRAREGFGGRLGAGAGRDGARCGVTDRLGRCRAGAAPCTACIGGAAGRGGNRWEPWEPLSHEIESPGLLSPEAVPRQPHSRWEPLGTVARHPPSPGRGATDLRNGAYSCASGPRPARECGPLPGVTGGGRASPELCERRSHRIH